MVNLGDGGSYCFTNASFLLDTFLGPLVPFPTLNPRNLGSEAAVHQMNVPRRARAGKWCTPQPKIKIFDVNRWQQVANQHWKVG